MSGAEGVKTCTKCGEVKAVETSHADNLAEMFARRAYEAEIARLRAELAEAQK